MWFETFIVIFEDEYKSCFGFKTFDDRHFIPFRSSTHRDFEVIGNIYENKDLLDMRKDLMKPINLNRDKNDQHLNCLCPMCMNFVKSGNNYCLYCGQKLDWSR